MICEKMWNVIAHIKERFGFIFVGFGDFKQLKPIGENEIDFKNSWIVKHVFGNNLCELTKVHRFKDDTLLQDAYKCSNGDAIDFNDLSLIHISEPTRLLSISYAGVCV